MATERTDPMAATLAEMGLRGLLYDWLRRAKEGTLPGNEPEWDMARAVVGLYVARVERRDGLRRVVLCGPWEIDPAMGRTVVVSRADAA